MTRPFWVLWLSQVINRFGDGFNYIALSWLLYSVTGTLAPFLLWHAGMLRAWHVYTVFMVNGMLGTPYGPASGALLIGLLRVPGEGAPHASGPESPGPAVKTYWAALRSGWRILTSDRRLSAISMAQSPWPFASSGAAW